MLLKDEFSKIHAHDCIKKHLLSVLATGKSFHGRDETRRREYLRTKVALGYFDRFYKEGEALWEAEKWEGLA